MYKRSSKLRKKVPKDFFYFLQKVKAKLLNNGRSQVTRNLPNGYASVKIGEAGFYLLAMGKPAGSFLRTKFSGAYSGNWKMVLAQIQF